MSNKGGAPTKYNSEMIAEVDVYLALKKDHYLDKKLKVKLPSIEDFATHLGVARQSIYNWRDEHKEFDNALEKIDSEQRQRLIDMGLSGEYNPTITKVLLSANHGLREGIDATSKGEKINEFTNEQIDRIADRVARRRNGDGGASSEK